MERALKMKPQVLLPLSPAMLDILLAVNHEPLHGYAIIKQIEDDTGERTPVGTLYRTIARLLENGLIKECEPPEHILSNDERRRYYQIEESGKAVLAAEVQRLEAIVKRAKKKQNLDRLITI
jgi:DNA-binding PadR family transcriptional regulator